MKKAVFVGFLALMACAPVDTKTELVTALPAGPVSAYPGATILDFRLSKALPNAFGNADLFGRRTDAGRTMVRYAGVRDGKAVFERRDVRIYSNATTMSETPLFLPNTSSSSVVGNVGSTPFSATGQSTTYSYIPARGSDQAISEDAPSFMAVPAGGSFTVEDKTVTVLSISGDQITYQFR